jgi:CO dehydrogenase maturation factor
VFSIKVAVSGKGGVGKTSVCAYLAKAWANVGFSVFAVDADPDTNLGWALGFDMKTLAQQKPLSELEDVIAERAGKGGFVVLNPEVSDLIPKYSLEKDGVKLLRMGNVKKGGSGCYCGENSFLRAIVAKLLIGKNDRVIMDMSAGFEHLTRGTTRHVDLLLVVVEPSHQSINTAKSISKLSSDLGIERIRVVGNKVQSEEEAAFLRQQLGDTLLSVLPMDPDFWAGSRKEGFDGTSTEFGKAVTRLAEELNTQAQ